METVNIMEVAAVTEFGATAADRIRGGKTGILFFNTSNLRLGLVRADGTAWHAEKSGGDNTIIFVAD